MHQKWKHGNHFHYLLRSASELTSRYCSNVWKSNRHLSLVEVSHIDLPWASHFQGGYSTNLAPGKLVGKLFTSIDKSIHRMIGTVPPPPEPPSQENNSQSNEHDTNSVAPKVANSQSTMALSSLMASAEPINEWAGGSNKMMPNRSVSEPNFGRNSKQVDIFWQIFFCFLLTDSVVSSVLLHSSFDYSMLVSHFLMLNLCLALLSLVGFVLTICRHIHFFCYIGDLNSCTVAHPLTHSCPLLAKPHTLFLYVRNKVLKLEGGQICHPWFESRQPSCKGLIRVTPGALKRRKIVKND